MLLYSRSLNSHSLSGAPTHRAPALIALFVVALLSGCVSQPQVLPTIGNWDHYQTQLAQLQSWQLNGKLGVRVSAIDPESGKPKQSGGSAYLDWEQSPSNYVIRLNGPLGQGTTWIKGNSDRVSLEQAGEAPLTASSADELVYNTLGWELPIDDLFYWVRGIPSPEAPVNSQTLNPSGSLSQLTQSGWQLTYSGYNIVGPWQLPGKIIAEHNNARIILVIKHWQL